MHILLEHQLSKPRGLLEESFQYCRGPTLRLRMTLLNKLVEKWKVKLSRRNGVKSINWKALFIGLDLNLLKRALKEPP